jgi:hypothetical protein
MKKYWIAGTFFVGLFSNGWSQTAGSSIIEIEAKGTVTFAPDSFVVLYRLDRSNINLENKEIVTEAPVEVQEVEYRDVEIASDMVVEEAISPPPPPPTQEEMVDLRKRREEESRRSRLMRDSILAIKEKRFVEFTKKVTKMGLNIPKEAPGNTEIVGYLEYNNNEYRRDEFVQVVSLEQYKNIDSLSQLYGRVLKPELLDIRMKNHDAIKKRAYQKAIENGKREAEILTSAMNLKLGKIVEISTESIGLEEILPIVLKKELSREFRKRESLQPELYQLMHEFQIETSSERKQGFNTKMIEWTWTEKVHIRYQTTQ